MTKQIYHYSSAKLGSVNYFFAKHLTAAGIPYIVTSQHTWKKWAWFVVVWLLFLGMSYMTYQVAEEYLKYPTSLKTERKSATVLGFPAVTVCGLNLIPKANAVPADIQYIISMKETLYKLLTYNVSDQEKRSCRIDPLCTWSWTTNECLCVASPCDTTLCFPHTEDTDDDDTCTCSMLFCQTNDPEMKDACYMSYVSNGRSDLEKNNQHCYCYKSFHYSGQKNTSNTTLSLDSLYEDEYINCLSLEKAQTERCVFYQALKSSGFDERGIELITRIRASSSDDLRDVKKLYDPSVQITSEYGNTFDDVLLSCSFGAKECSRKNFSVLFSSTYGRCFMFNYVGSDDKQPAKVRHAGRTNGLQLYLQAREADSIDLLTTQRGMRIIVHDPHMAPFAAEHGIDIRPGDMSNIDVEYINISRLGKPWGNCITDGSSLPFNYDEKVYSRAACERLCLKEITYNRCKCYHPKFLVGTTTLNRKLRLCNIAHHKRDNECVQKVLKARNRGQIMCDCPFSCRENRYVTSLSAGLVNENFFRLVRTAKSIRIQNGIPLIPSFTDNFTMMGVRVYYKDMFYTSITETEAYSWQSLIANIGGNMGLFLGLSLVTFLEIFEFVSDLLWSKVKIVKKKKKKKSQKMPIKIYPKEVIVWNRKKKIDVVE